MFVWTKSLQYDCTGERIIQHIFPNTTTKTETIRTTITKTQQQQHFSMFFSESAIGTALNLITMALLSRQISHVGTAGIQRVICPRKYIFFKQSKWSKIVQNSQTLSTWIKMHHYGPIWSKLLPNSPKLYLYCQSGGDVLKLNIFPFSYDQKQALLKEG